LTPDVILSFDQGFLKPMVVEDISPAYLEGINDPEVNRYLVNAREQKQSIDLLEYFVKANAEAEDSVLFGIWSKSPTELVGTLRLHAIESVHKTAHIGICVFARKYWGRGIGTAAIATATKWSFSGLNLRWLEAGTYDENIASRKSFMKAGYEKIADIHGKYLFEGEPASINILAAKNIDRA